MKKPLVTTSNLATAAGVIFLGFVGYVFVASLPDLRRYIRITNM